MYAIDMSGDFFYQYGFVVVYEHPVESEYAKIKLILLRTNVAPIPRLPPQASATSSIR